MKALNVLKYVGFGILGVGFMIGVIFGVQALWNWLIPVLFNGPELTFWQTVGIFFLSKILFTGIGPGSHHSHDEKWNKKYYNKFKRTPEKDQEIVTAEPV